MCFTISRFQFSSKFDNINMKNNAPWQYYFRVQVKNFKKIVCLFSLFDLRIQWSPQFNQFWRNLYVPDDASVWSFNTFHAIFFKEFDGAMRFFIFIYPPPQILWNKSWEHEVEDDLGEFIEVEDGKKMISETSKMEYKCSYMILRPSSTSSAPSSTSSST